MLYGRIVRVVEHKELRMHKPLSHAEIATLNGVTPNRVVMTRTEKLQRWAWAIEQSKLIYIRLASNLEYLSQSDRDRAY
jgi:hypothetical protein